jgi:DNA-binding PadR family transcriptional regulator
MHEAFSLNPRLLGWHAMTRGGRGHGPHHGGRHGGPPFGFGGWGPPRGPRARRGDVRAAILVLLGEEPRNGYQLMQAIEQRSDGLWKPSPGSIYPALQQLEDEGLVVVQSEEGRKWYVLTDDGRSHVDQRADELGAPWDAVKGDVGEGARELMGAMRQIGMALFQIAQTGNEAQQAEARKVLDGARRSLYRILAGDEDDPVDGEA